ncbi:YbgA family protein [Oceanospirillum sediminis]|uniref:DUF1722 domain-containing protein n=1 Tax=Oceanospirillum sediminis TaxID=2760088 RepID=A0A839IXI0_9GAMM|nr:DUF523 and DUF1722 domain-containing protein [Oceanospirillum sediminis]MBB1488796.1 DUF1722 domain-containing protein [Oceanospirillum sediminis]
MSDLSSLLFPENEIRIGISQCLLGSEVRFDGGHKKSRFCTDTLGKYVKYVPVCPEAGAGLGIPREPIRLVDREAEGIRVRGTRSDDDYTEVLESFTQETVPKLDHLCGYIFLGKSPSCGMERVKVYRLNGHLADVRKSGVFAEAIMETYPALPTEESGRLNDPVLRESFLTRVFAYSSWQVMKREGITPGKLIEFHTQYKPLLMAHNQQAYRDIGAWLAGVNKENIAEKAEEYLPRMMAILKQPASRKNHTNALMHLQGYLKKSLSSKERQHLRDTIDQYRTGQIPLIAPLVLMRHLFEVHGCDYAGNYRYLFPYPEALAMTGEEQR